MAIRWCRCTRTRDCRWGSIRRRHTKTSPPTCPPADTLVLYTDGITEARAPVGDLLGTTRFDDILSRCTGSAAEIAAQALAAVGRFTEGGPITDDRTLLVAKVS